MRTSDAGDQLQCEEPRTGCRHVANCFGSAQGIAHGNYGLAVGQVFQIAPSVFQICPQRSDLQDDVRVEGFGAVDHRGSFFDVFLVQEPGCLARMTLYKYVAASVSKLRQRGGDQRDAALVRHGFFENRDLHGGVVSGRGQRSRRYP